MIRLEITRNNDSEGCKIGDLVELPPLDQRRIARLVDGFKTTDDFWSARRDKIGDFTNSETREKFEQMFDWLKAD